MYENVSDFSVVAFCWHDDDDGVHGFVRQLLLPIISQIDIVVVKLSHDVILAISLEMFPPLARMLI